jgi:hypothetical protein
MGLDQQSELRTTHGIVVTRDVLGRSHVTRSRVLAGMGAALTAAALRLWFPETASALYPTPNGCYPAGSQLGCTSCSGSTCTPGCTASKGSCPPYQPTSQCWITCAYEGSTLYKFRCCDWVNSSHQFCECRGYIGPC